MPLRYTIREHLERIGDPAGTTHPFSARYAYHPNGTVWEAEFYNAGSPASAKRYRYVFGTTSYDALNRLTSADFSSYSAGWQITAAHDLANITYNVAGNITALQRYRETATLIDNLTYSYPGTSNRLSSVSDAVGTTAETWDAETGSFTYDANGNLKTAPAPYAITAVTYDHQNLALSLTSAGTTKTYRYNEAGQRITKQVGTGNTEVYLLDGMSSLGVVTVNGSGSVVASYFNVLAGDKVVGRQPGTGNRRYYHTDLLGSTRAVVEGAGVVESYDFEPWGLLMPGRTLAGPTKEGFTSKERDAESGLDYFGARYYMAALARWTAVDPLAEKHPEWSPYNYVLGNPLMLIDPDGRQVSPNSLRRRLPLPTPDLRAPGRDPARFFAREPVRPGMVAGATARTATLDAGRLAPPLPSTVSAEVTVWRTTVDSDNNVSVRVAGRPQIAARVKVGYPAHEGGFEGVPATTGTVSTPTVVSVGAYQSTDGSSGFQIEIGTPGSVAAVDVRVAQISSGTSPSGGTITQRPDATAVHRPSPLKPQPELRAQPR